MSRHPPTLSQLLALSTHFPSHTLIVDARPFSGAAQITERFTAASGDVLVIVAPWPIMRELNKRGITPLHAEMKSVSCDGPHEVSMGPPTRHRCADFVRFVWCRSVEIKLDLVELGKELQPQ